VSSLRTRLRDVFSSAGRRSERAKSSIGCLSGGLDNRLSIVAENIVRLQIGGCRLGNLTVIARPPDRLASWVSSTLMHVKNDHPHKPPIHAYLTGP